MKSDVIILAGGLGTRLQNLLPGIPKPMVPVNDQPFLKYLLGYVNKFRPTRIILSVGYRHEQIREYFGDNFEGTELLYSIEEFPLGTGGAIFQSIQLSDSDHVFILNGDTFFDVDLDQMESQHINKQPDITIALKEMRNFERYGSVFIQDNRITRFIEKQYVERGQINAGTYLLNKQRFLENHWPEKFSFEKEYLEKFVEKGFFAPFYADGYFIDIGIPEDYAKAQHDFKTKRALFLDRDGVINKEINYLYRKEDFVFIDGIFEICEFYQRRGFVLIVITNQAGIAKGYYTEEDYNILTEWMIAEFSKRSIAINRVYHCPHFPEITGDCGCRKPNPGMLLQAQSEFNIDLPNSILIGDKQSDFDAAINSGIKNYYHIDNIIKRLDNLPV
ncbi:MAG: D-glycero-beta-D-manno-heptose 1,7-bisphosphate 7-phosphatase [Prolixibacteraceae bacterium]